MLIISERDAQQIRDGVLRLHIVANSDSEYDQQNKMSVRDGIAQLCSQLFTARTAKLRLWIAQGKTVMLLSQGRKKF